MKISGWLYLFVLILFSCKENTQSQLEHLTGYWEISAVKQGNEVIKTFGVSPTIDYIEISGKHGFRKKLQVDLLGNFKANPTLETIEVEIIDGEVILNYTTAFSSWSEVVVSATRQELTVENEANLTYTYKRYKPLDLKP